MSSDDANTTRMLFQAVQDLTKQFGTIQGDIKEDVAQLLRNYREDIFRTTMGIHARLLSYEDELVKDSVAREKRQKEIDSQYGELRNELTEIKHNQRFLVRLAVVMGILALGVVIGWLVL